MFPRASIFKTSAFIFHERFKINFEGSSIHAHCLLLFIVSYGLLLLSIRIVASQKIKYEQVLTGFGFFKMRSFEFEQTKRCMGAEKVSLRDINISSFVSIYIPFCRIPLFLYKITLLHIVVIHSSKVYCFISFIGTFTLGDLTVHEK